MDTIPGRASSNVQRMESHQSKEAIITCRLAATNPKRRDMRLKARLTCDNAKAWGSTMYVGLRSDINPSRLRRRSAKDSVQYRYLCMSGVLASNDEFTTVSCFSGSMLGSSDVYRILPKPSSLSIRRHQSDSL